MDPLTTPDVTYTYTAPVLNGKLANVSLDNYQAYVKDIANCELAVLKKKKIHPFSQIETIADI